jgi:predicted 3-demethylubiquinone-9 3-methyltransferase (glyoxalase superfamily)
MHPMANQPQLSACLWFDNEAEAAANYYVEIFKGSILHTARFGKAGFEYHHRPEGSVMTVKFSILGNEFTALNGGPLFKFNEAVSFVVECETQPELDHYWEKLTAGGDPNAQQCGWLKDKFGLSWQIIPTGFEKMVGENPTPASERAMHAMMGMKKIDMAKLQQAYDG